MSARASLLGLALAASCSGPPRDLDHAASGSTSDATDDATDGDPSDGLDVPAAERACEAEGGHFAQVGGPWVVQDAVPDPPSAMGVLPDGPDLLALWRAPVFPEANVVARRMSASGAALEPVALDWERPAVGASAVHRAAEGYVLTYCSHFNSDFRVTSRIIAGDGSVLAPEQERAGSSHCISTRPQGVWTGERYLFLWTDELNGRLVMDIGEPTQAQSTEWIELSPDGNDRSPPRAAVGPGVVAVVAGIRSDQLQVFRFAPDGTAIDSASLDLPVGFSIGPTAIGAAPDGSFSVFVANQVGPGLWRAWLDVTGNATGLVPVDGAWLRYTDLRLLHRPGGLLLITEGSGPQTPSRVGFIATNDVGVPVMIDSISDEQDPGDQTGPAATFMGEDAWVLYTSARSDETYDLRLAQLSCVH